MSQFLEKLLNNGRTIERTDAGETVRPNFFS